MPRRCAWAGDDPLMQAYHDEEWGRRQRDPRMLWEMLMLESFQAGLSWSVVLHKREALRKAFKNFDPRKVARFGKSDVERLLKDEGIIRSRAKIEAVIAGARIFLGMDFASFCKSVNEAEQASKDLKQLGFKFIGPTIVYAWMQAVGIVDDHSPDCFRHRRAKQA
ncbi:MAG TPA: DNA-3-methyladenine glycosylase I [Polyangiales bacterium]